MTDLCSQRTGALPISNIYLMKKICCMFLDGAPWEWDSVDHRDHIYFRSMLIFTVQGLWQHVKQIAHQSPSSIGPRGGGCPSAGDIRTSGRTQTEAEPWSQQTRLSHWGAGLTLQKALKALTTLGLGVQSGKALFCWIQVQCKHRELLWSYFAATGLHPTHFLH